jgi:hypothetical protein
MPVNNPDRYVKRGVPSSGLKKPDSPKKKVEAPTTHKRKAKTTTELERRLKARRS